MAPHRFLPVLVAAGLACLGGVRPVRAGTNALAWTFEDDAVGAVPAGWQIMVPVGDFVAEVRQERGNKYLHVGGTTNGGSSFVAATWGRGKPSSEWIYTGTALFRIRFWTVCPIAALTLCGNVPANGPDNDHRTLLFVTFTEHGTTNMAVGVSGQGAIGTFPTGQWQTVRLDFQGATEPVATGDGKSHGTWRMSVGTQVATGEFGRVNNTFPFGSPVNGFRFGKWFRDPVAFDLDDVRIAGVTRDPEEPGAAAPAGPAPTGRGDDRIPRLKVDGVTYYNVRFGATMGERVVLFHSDGLANVPVAKLPAPYNAQFGSAPAAPARPASTEEPRGHEPAPPSPSVADSVLGAPGTLSELTGFVQTRIELTAFGGRGPGVLLEVARKREAAQKLPAAMELRPAFWEGLGEYVLLTNASSQWREGQIVRVRVTEGKPLKRYRVFAVTGEF